MSRYQGSPSMDGNSTKFWIGGTTPYSNALYWKRLSGDSTKISKWRNFLYETYFYYTNSYAVQALEFDVNQLTGGRRYIWGTQCNVRAGSRWDIWDNRNKRWVGTSNYCSAPPTYKWNKVILEMKRTSENKLHYVSITINHSTHYLNKYYSPTSKDWTGLTMNFQLDGNSKMTDYAVWLDNFKVTAW